MIILNKIISIVMMIGVIDTVLYRDQNNILLFKLQKKTNLYLVHFVNIKIFISFFIITKNNNKLILFL